MKKIFLATSITLPLFALAISPPTTPTVTPFSTPTVTPGASVSSAPAYVSGVSTGTIIANNGIKPPKITVDLSLIPNGEDKLQIQGGLNF